MDLLRDNELIYGRLLTIGEPHLIDFGLAHQKESGQRITQAGTLLGTPAYMAPEQITAQPGPALPASDQYSLGVLLYELLTGRTPFDGPTEVVLFNALHKDPPPPRSLRYLPSSPAFLQSTPSAESMRSVSSTRPCAPQSSSPAAPPRTSRSKRFAVLA